MSFSEQFKFYWTQNVRFIDAYFTCFIWNQKTSLGHFACLESILYQHKDLE